MLQSGSSFPVSTSLPLLLTALILLVIAVFSPFMGFEAGGKENNITLAQGIANVFEYDEPIFALLAFGMVVIYPVVILGALLVIISGYRSRMARYRWFRTLLRWARLGTDWTMVEVFIIGIMVSLVKISSMADIQLGEGFFLYCAFAAMFTITIRKIDFEELSSEDYGSGHHHHRRPYSIQNTMAWLVTSVLLYIPANTLPIMTTYHFGEPSHNTILSGVIYLWDKGSYLIATVIFLASIVVPLGKIITLSYLCLSVYRKDVNALKTKTRAYEITEVLGKWSMIDVFVVLTLVTLVQLGHTIAIHSNLGVLAFAGVVICTMLAARSFDPRLLWELQTNSEPRNP